MAVAEFRIFLNDKPADEDLLDIFREIKVDQAIGLATEAELHVNIRSDDTGVWTGIEEDFAQPLERLRVEIRIGDGEFVPLIDGPIIGQRYVLSASANESEMVLVAHDDSVLLNRMEAVELYENMAPDAIARKIFQEHNLTAEVDSVPGSSGGLTRYIVRRGTPMQILRDLARRHGMFVYVCPGESPGKSKGYFKRLSPTYNGLPELLLMGRERNVDNFTAEFDALRPLTSRASSVRINDKSILSSDASASTFSPQGDIAVHNIISPGHTILARTREEESDLEEATKASVDCSSWAYTANAEVTADIYPGVLSPYNLIRVTGVGGFLGGDYLLSHVTHLIDDDSYKQRFTMKRNARSGGTENVAGNLAAEIL